MEDDVAGGMPWRVVNDCLARAQTDDVAFANRLIDCRNFFSLASGADNPAIPLFFQGLVSARVIPVPMGVQNMGQPPAFPFQRGVDRLGVRRVDCGDSAGFGVANQIPVIILKARELSDLDIHA